MPAAGRRSRSCGVTDHVLGIDYGGSSTKLLLAAAGVREAAPVAQTRVPTPRGAGALEELAAHVETFVAGRSVRGAAVTVAGIVDDRGVVVTSSNLPWLAGLAIGDVLRARLGFPVVPVHDGRAAARAEAVLGAGRGHEDTYVVALGTGVGSAHVVRGVVEPGAHNAAGEIGHISQDEHGRLCSCRQRGCLETFIGGAHLARRWREVVTAEGCASPDELAALTAQDLVAAARAGHPGAAAIVDEATAALARGLLGMLATVDPGRVVVGGGLGQAPDVILEPTVAQLRARATFHQIPPIVPATLGPWAGAWGAALTADELATAPLP
ncbi:sugar kinase [Pseudonocardia sp. MH-G8]|nr:sugar kinase [Pseudonocardia sp. MH-G8]